MSYLPIKLNPLNLDVKEPAWKSLMQKLDMVSYHCSMPVLENVQVSLNEVLEVRGQSLEEWELWGVLFQTTEAVQDVFLRGQALKDGVPQYLVTPDNLLCTSMGRILLNVCVPESIKGTKYWCSEMTDEEFSTNNSDLDKVYVFTIGQTMLHATYYGIQDNYKKKLSPLFKTILQSMSQKDTDLRMVLADISEVCRFHAKKHMKGYSFLKSVISLHREVLGSLPENEILTQVDQDVKAENDDEVIACEPDDDFMNVNYDTKSFSYGHRLGYHPELSSARKSAKTLSKITPKERWKKAYNKVIAEIRKSKLPLLDREKIMEEWKKHKAHQTIFRVYEELTERRKMLELLRLSINIGPSAPLDVDKNPLLMTGLKPKTFAELVLLLQRPSKQTVIGSSSSDAPGGSSESSNVTSELPYPFDDGSHRQPYYALHKIISKIPFNTYDINSLPGPEFVIGRLKSHMRISLLPSDSLEYQSSIVNLSVLLLTGESIDVECLHSTSGKQLFQAVATHIKLQERYIFGLACETGGEYIFIERKQKLGEFLQGCTSSPVPINSFQLLFKVKFYLDDVHLMRTRSLQHLFYLQLRKDLLNDDFNPEIKFALTLGGLALQAEFGDYDSSTHGKEYFLLEHYLPFQCIKQNNRNDMKSKLQNHHSNLRGISKELSELKFIQNMKLADEYGCHFHKVLQDKRNISSAVWLGIKPRGIEVYEIVSGKRSVCQNYPWQSILRISFSQKCFCLVPRTESITGKRVAYRFYTSVLNRSLYLFNIAMAHHKFYLKLKSVTKASEIFFEDFDAENFCALNKSGIEKEIGCDLYDLEGNLQLMASKTSKHKNSERKGSSLKKASFTDLSNLQLFKNLLPCIEDVIILSSKGSGRIKRKKKYPNIVMRSSSDPVKKDHSYLSNRIFSTKDLTSCIPNNIRNGSAKNLELKFVRLHKDVKYGLGMVITCGDSYDTILHGAFVESIHPGSPADLNGNISPGDQIMSVNGTNVQNDYFLSVVDLIQCSNNPVDLVVAKTGKNTPDSPKYQTKEIYEAPFTKTKAWIVGDDKSESAKKIEEMPVPKPRKKLSQKKSCDQPQLDGPDLTLNHLKQSTPKTWNNEPDPNVINEHLNSKNWSIPDIIASQIKHVDSIASDQPPKSTGKDEHESLSMTDTDKNDLLPGEVYHVVLDKKGGSLGLNIFQGTETTSSLQKHIYIHSIIPDGAAELDGRIKSGDKLLEVNGILLENLTYQEVVTTLRESPQVAHLVLEKGTCFPNKSLQDDFPSGLSNLSLKKELPSSKDDERKTNFHTLPQNGLFSCKSEMASKVHKGSDTVDTLDLSQNTVEDYFEEKNSFSSLPTSIESSLNCAKETSSAPSLQPSDHLKNNGKLSISSCDDFHVSRKSNDSFSSHSQAKDGNRFKNFLTSYKSSPNLADSSDEEENRNVSRLYRNPSTDCLMYSPHFMNPHQALFDLYQNYAYIRGSSCNIHQIPAVPIRKKKLKKLEDIYNYCNIENTFIVTIRKSSRGLGLSISGGRDASRKDPFSQLIQIRKLYPLQPALECGKLALGDVILEVNGTSMLGLTNTEALEILRSAPEDVVLKVFRPSKSLIPSFSVFKGSIWPGFNSSSSSASSSLSRNESNSYNVETGEFEVTLMKRDGSLGFTIFKRDKCNESPEGIYVKALVREHAVSDGRIQPGDRILQVNGTDVSSLSHGDAITCLRNATDEVTLKLYRDDPPLTPANFEDDCHISKPLRWEAVELLNDRVKQKDLNDESNTLKRKIKRKLDRSSNAPSTASSESASSTSSFSGQEHVIDGGEMLGSLDDELSLEGIGLQRNQRPKSLDVLNSSDRKRFIGHSEDENFHRQSSVMCPNVESKAKNESDETSGNSGKRGGKNLLKWRGSTLDSEDSSSIDTILENSVLSPKSLNIEKQMSSENKSDEEDFRPVPFPRTTSYSNEWVHTFDVSLDRGWHLRLGFSVQDPPETVSDSPQKALPPAAEVKAVYPGSLAEKDGRIRVGDRIVEVNGESLLGKTAHEVIDILRKTRGVIRMVFCRLESRS